MAILLDVSSQEIESSREGALVSGELTIRQHAEAIVFAPASLAYGVLVIPAELRDHAQAILDALNNAQGDKWGDTIVIYDPEPAP